MGELDRKLMCLKIEPGCDGEDRLKRVPVAIDGLHRMLEEQREQLSETD